MATVKFHEGTKFETTLDLEEDDGVIFVRPPKNLIARNIPAGCLFFLKPAKNWNINLVITSKRLITIPLPPNKKNFAVESYYFKDISKAKALSQVSQNLEARFANFAVYMKPGFSSPTVGEGMFMIRMEMTTKNFLNVLKVEHIEGAARDAHITSAAFSNFDYGVYTKKSIDRYYAAMEKAARDRAANLDLSNAGHQQMRDYIVDVINQCVAEANT